MKINALIKKINRELPEAKAVSTKEWDGSDDGIWFRGSEDYVEADERLIFGGGGDVHPKLEKILHDDQRTSAPSATSVSISTAVCTVMCIQPRIFAVASGFWSAYLLRRVINAGISASANVTSRRPKAARLISATL